MLSNTSLPMAVSTLRAVTHTPQVMELATTKRLAVDPLLEDLLMLALVMKMPCNRLLRSLQLLLALMLPKIPSNFIQAEYIMNLPAHLLNWITEFLLLDGEPRVDLTTGLSRTAGM